LFVAAQLFTFLSEVPGARQEHFPDVLHKFLRGRFGPVSLNQEALDIMVANY
jgi:hypothetical protein